MNQSNDRTGAVFGMLLGMAVILVITWNMQDLIRRDGLSFLIPASQKPADR